MTKTDLPSPRVPADVLKAEGFDPAESAGLFVGVSRFDDPRFAEIPFAVDDAVDLAALFAHELRLISPEKVVLGLAGEPRKPESVKRLHRLLEAGARREKAHQTDIYAHLDAQRRAAGRAGLFIAAIATHGFSDQGGDFLVAANSLKRRIVRTGVAVDELFDDVAQANSPRRIVLLDACRERLSKATRAGGDAEAAMSRSFADAIAAASGQVVLAGATLGGYAYDDLERRNGVFSAAIIDGLRGQADVDEYGFITVRTLADYLNRRVVAWIHDHWPEHVAVSQGIAQRIEGDAARLPLAVDPARREAEAAYSRRRDAALVRLRENIGETITGALYDEMAAVLAEVRSRPEVEPLLEEIEALDGHVRSQRGLAYYFQLHRENLQGEKAGEVSIEPVLGIGFRRVGPGIFLMGSPDDEPERDSDERQHEVTLTRGFQIAETAVTQGEWQKLTGNNPAHFRGDDQRPVEQVSWFDAVAFANLLSERAGLEPCYELINGNGRAPGDGFECTEVRLLGLELPGCFDPNPWGLYEIHGNVWEWVWDWFGVYPLEQVPDPVGPETGSARVFRGGSWLYYARYCRSAYRVRLAPGYRSGYLGFRLVRPA